MVKLTNVHKSYKSGEIEVKVLEGLDLYIQKGEFVALIGPSGSGKTTILNIIGALDKADSGNVEVAGVEIGKEMKKNLQNLEPIIWGIFFRILILLKFSAFLKTLIFL